MGSKKGGRKGWKNGEEKGGERSWRREGKKGEEYRNIGVLCRSSTFISLGFLRASVVIERWPDYEGH